MQPNSRLTVGKLSRQQAVVTHFKMHFRLQHCMAAWGGLLNHQKYYLFNYQHTLMPFHSIFVHMKPPYSLQTSRSGHRNGGCRSRRHGCLHPVRSGRQRGRRDTLHKPASMRPLVKAGWGMWVLRFVCVKCKWCKQHWFIVASQLLHISYFTALLCVTSFLPRS